MMDRLKTGRQSSVLRRTARARTRASLRSRLGPDWDDGGFGVRSCGAPLPADLASAHSLFARDPFEFERWAVSLVRGTPNEKQVGDKGRDGIIRFFQGKKEKPGQIVVSVKGGKQLNPAMVRDLEGVVAHDPKLSGGILITVWNPTLGMKQAADTSALIRKLVVGPGGSGVAEP